MLNKIGPAITASLGVLGYIIYVGSLWYFDSTGKEGFPIFAGVCIGVSCSVARDQGIGTKADMILYQISAGLIFVVMGSIAMSYSEEQDRGKYITMSINLQAVGAMVGGIIPLIINRDSVSLVPMLRQSGLTLSYRPKQQACLRPSTLSSSS